MYITFKKYDILFNHISKWNIAYSHWKKYPKIKNPIWVWGINLGPISILRRFK